MIQQQYQSLTSKVLGSIMDSQQANQGRLHEFIGSASICVCKGSIHNKVAKFYVICQPTTTLIFLGLGSTVSKIHNTKH
jgi:hypothetical protein